MTSIVKSIEKPFKDEEKKIKAAIIHEKEKIGYELDKFGQYMLLGGICALFIGIPLINEAMEKIPEAIDQAAKIADIVKPI